jgi:hypothetical protein
MSKPGNGFERLLYLREGVNIAAAEVYLGDVLRSPSDLASSENATAVWKGKLRRAIA